MRSRYLISAAVLVAAACIGRRREASAPAEPAAPAWDDVPVAAEPPAAPAPVEEAVAEEALPVEDPAPAEEPVAEEPVADEPVAEESAPVEEPAPAEEPVAEPAVAERGRFSLGGQALAPGHAVVAGITFASRREVPVGADALRLRVERAFNMPEGGLVVLDDPGFAPDAEGFTLALAAAAPGGFAAAGTYELLADPSFASPSASTGGTAR